MPDRLYLDHNATSPLRPEVRDAMLEAMDGAHNPSSVHQEGRAAKALLEKARNTVSQVLSVPKEGIIFTSGGTEADNLALSGMVHGPKQLKRFFISAIEHDAVTKMAQALSERGVAVETIPVDVKGVIKLDWLEQRLAEYDPDTDGAFLVCVMLANNETGVIQPVQQLGSHVWPKGGFVFVDAVQGVGKLAIDFDAIGADLMSIGAHKIGGPVGVGALVMKPGIPLAPLQLGGGQETYRRAGTENIASIIGLVKTLEVASPTEYADLAAIRDEIEQGLPQSIKIWGRDAKRLPNTSNFSAPGFKSETQVMVMDLAGIAISSGSACSSGKVRKSAVLTAMGATEEEANSAIRISLGWNTPADSAQRFLSAWQKEFDRISSRNAA